MANSPAASGSVRSDRRSFFEYYKRGQGNWTRGGTAAGAGILALAGSHFLYNKLDIFDQSENWGLYVQIGASALFTILLGLLIWWIVGVNRKTCDFFIATEGEMKKVSWSSRREIIGSTKVVILFTFLFALLLFIVDMIFKMLFTAIGVLH